MSRNVRPGKRDPHSASPLRDGSRGQRGVRLDSFCGVLDATALAEFKSLCSTGAVEPAHYLFHEGDPADAIYNVTRGTLKLYRLLPDGRRQIARFVHAGDFLGLTLRRSHDYTAETLEPVDYCRFARERFDRFVDRHPALGRQLYMVAAQELAAAREQLIALGRKTARERLASLLLDLFDRARPRNAGCEVIHLPMSRVDIADYLGLTKETVSRLFTSLREARLIALISDDRVELLERTRLERLARGEGD